VKGGGGGGGGGAGGGWRVEVVVECVRCYNSSLGLMLRPWFH